MIHICKSTQAHVDGIHTIETLSFPDPWSKSSLSEEIDTAISIVAVDDSGQVLGHISMRHIINEGHISNLAVHPDFRQQGVGHKLLSALVNIAHEKEMIGLTLEVRVSNQPAIHLYQRHGFISEGIRKNYYSMPNEDGVIMWKHLEKNL